MTAIRVIPCLDVHGGKVVKGVKFEDLKEKGDPARLAQRYEEEGADEIVFLDISATIEERRALYEKVEETASTLSIPLTVGGGIKTLEDVSKLFSFGADKVSMNTGAIKNPGLIEETAREYGSQAVVVAIDVKLVEGKYIVFTHSGKNKTEWVAEEWAKRVETLGAGEILLTSIDRDGTRKGFDTSLIGAVRRNVKLPIIASGGAGNPRHFVEAVRAGADAVLAAGIFHEEKVRIIEVKQELFKNGVEVRL